MINQVQTPIADSAVDAENIRAPHSFAVAEQERLQPVTETLKAAEGFDRLADLLLAANADVNASAHLYTDPFEDSRKKTEAGGKPLYKTLGGRLLTQLASRGIFAAAMFTLGTYMEQQWLPGAGLGKDQPLLGKPLEAMSMFLDTALTKPATFALQHGLRMDADHVRELMTFNPYALNVHKYQQAMGEAEKAGKAGTSTLTNGEVFGHSWGQEMVYRTWTFAAGSIGAAVGRNLVSVMDPNQHTSWLKDGHIDYKDMAVSSLKSLWRIMTFNQMEDWFAAPFYTISLRVLRGGFHQEGALHDAVIMDMQNGGNGTARLMNKDQTLGDSFTAQSVIDFQTRFMTYNFYTLLFRDLHNHLMHVITDMKEGHTQDPKPSEPGNPLQDVAHNASETVKYLLKSLVKSQIYMAPAMLAFWPQNVGMSEANHRLIDAESGQMLTTEKSRSYNPHSAENRAAPFIEGDIQTANSRIAATADTLRKGATMYHPDAPGEFTAPQPDYNRFNEVTNVTDHIINPIGQMGTNYANFLNNRITKPLVHAVEMARGKESPKLQQDIQSLTNTFARAQFAYVPYMIGKYETQQIVDTPQMDAALYRALDGLFSLNMEELCKGVQDIGRILTFRPVSNETEALTAENRGLINSRVESEKKADAAIQRVHEERAFNAEVKEVQKEIKETLREHGATPPQSHVAEAQRQGMVLEATPQRHL